MRTTAARPLAVMLTTLAVATPAHAADFSVDEDTQLSIYGSLEPKIITETDANGDDSTELADEDSTLGFRAEHGLRADLVAFGQVELEFSSDEPDSGFGGQDSAFAGLEGGFGKVKAGHFDNVYEDLIIDATEVAEDAEITDEAVASEDNMIAYYSPSFGGFHFRTQVRIQGQSELEDNTALNDANNEVGIAAAGGYTGERFGVYAGFDDRGAEVVDDFDANGNQVGEKISNSETYGVAATVDLAPVELAAKFARQDNPDNDPDGDSTSFSALRGTLSYSRGSVYGAVQEVSPDNGDDRTEVTLGADYDVLANVTLWSELGRFDQANDEGDNLMVGAILSF
jgi:predicted porin